MMMNNHPPRGHNFELDVERIAKDEDPINSKHSAGPTKADQIDLTDGTLVVDPPVRRCQSIGLRGRRREVLVGAVPMGVRPVVGIGGTVGVPPI